MMYKRIQRQRQKINKREKRRKQYLTVKHKLESFYKQMVQARGDGKNKDNDKQFFMPKNGKNEFELEDSSSDSDSEGSNTASRKRK